MSDMIRIRRAGQSNPAIPHLVIEAFKSEGFLVVNKSLIKKIGLLQTIILSNYIDKFQYFRSKSNKFNGWFFLRHKDIMDQLDLKQSMVIKIKKQLLALGLIRTRMRGLPIKEWIWIDFLRIACYFSTPQDFRGLNPKEVAGLLRRLKNKEYYLSDFKKKGSDGFITTKQFEEFWSMWPADKKGSKGKAITKWTKLCRDKYVPPPKWEKIVEAISNQKQSEQWKAGYIPHAVTWLNNQRWIDEPSQLKAFKRDKDKADQDRYIPIKTHPSDFYGNEE